MKTLKKVEKEFDEIEEEWVKHYTMNACSVCDSPKGHTILKSFITTSLRELLEQVVPEEGIEWMQEGNRKNKRGYTDGFNACRRDVEERIKNILNN